MVEGAWLTLIYNRAPTGDSNRDVTVDSLQGHRRQMGVWLGEM